MLDKFIIFIIALGVVLTLAVLWTLMMIYTPFLKWLVKKEKQGTNNVSRDRNTRP